MPLEPDILKSFALGADLTQADENIAALGKGASFTDSVAGAFEKTWETLWESLGKMLNANADSVNNRLFHAARALTEPWQSSDPTEIHSHLQDILLGKSRKESDLDPITGLIRLIMTVQSIWSIPSAANSVIYEKHVIQPLMSKVLPSLPPPEVIARGLYRGAMELSEAESLLTLHGYSPDRQNLILQAARPLADPAQAIAALRRGLATEQETIQSLARHGFDGPTIRQLIDVSWAVPSFQDVILFSVREVYDSEIREKFGQDQGFEKMWEKAEADATAAGLKKETMAKYWAAHWELPSVRQGFEMLHRRVIDEETLESLFVARDVMPGWREQLKAISYDPYTRVDVRRMHKLGILNDQQTLDAYRDLGYDEEKAANMLAFTIAYNADPEAQDASALDMELARERELTKTDVLQLYQYGQLERDETVAMLVNLGYSAEATEFLVDRVDFKEQQKTIDKYLRLYKDLYIEGVISREQTEAVLAGFNFSSSRISKILESWDLERLGKEVIPSKTELVRFLKKGIIDRQEFTDQMLRRRYGKQAIAWYLADLDTDMPEEG